MGFHDVIKSYREMTGEKRTFDLKTKYSSKDPEIKNIDTEIGKKINETEKRSNTKLNIYENDLRAINALNNAQKEIKSYKIDLDVVVERNDNQEHIYYIYGNNKALGKENILLNIPLSIEELEKLAGLIPSLFNTELSLSGKKDFRHINDNSLLGRFINMFSSNMLLKTRTKSYSRHIDDEKVLRYNNNIGEEIFKFVSKLKGIPDEKINVERSILNSGDTGKGGSNYEKIGFGGNPRLEKIINPREVKLEKNKTSSILKFGTNISFVLYDEYSQGYIINFNEENLIKTTKDLIKQKRSIESIKDSDIINIIDLSQSKSFIDGLLNEKTKEKEKENLEKQKKDTLKRYKDFINACINLEKKEFHPGSYQIPE